MAVRASRLGEAGDEGEILVRAFQGGDREAFARIFREHHEALVRQAQRRLGSREQAEDAVQEAFLRALRGLPGFGATGEFRLGAWLSRIVSNVCHTQHARSLAEHRMVQLAGQQEERLVAGGEPGGDPVTEELLQGALDALPPRQREAFVLRVVEGLDYPELAERTGVSEDNARARVHRARSTLRRNLNALSTGSYGVALTLVLAGRAALRRIPGLRLLGDQTSAPAGTATLGQLATNPTVQLVGATTTKATWLIGVAATVATVSSGGIATAIAMSPPAQPSAGTVRTVARPPSPAASTPAAEPTLVASSTPTSPAPRSAAPTPATSSVAAPSPTPTSLPVSTDFTEAAVPTASQLATTPAAPKVSAGTVAPDIPAPVTAPGPAAAPTTTATPPADPTGTAGGWVTSALQTSTPTTAGTDAPGLCAWWPTGTTVATAAAADASTWAMALSNPTVLSTTGSTVDFDDPAGSYQLPGATTPIAGASLSVQTCLPPLDAHLQFTLTVPGYEPVTGLGTMVATSGTTDDAGYLFRGTVALPPVGTDLAGGITDAFVAELEIAEPANTAQLSVAFLEPASTPASSTATSSTPTVAGGTPTGALTTTPAVTAGGSVTADAPASDDPAAGVPAATGATSLVTTSSSTQDASSPAVSLPATTASGAPSAD